MHVLVIAYDGCCALDVAGPIDVFSHANQVSGRELYRCDVVSVGGGAVMTESGLRIITDEIRAHRRAAPHTVLVSGGLGVRDALSDDELLASVTRLASRCHRLGSVCTGSFLLAEAGLLDGRIATTHWKWADEFVGRYPGVRLVPDRLYVTDGEIVTAAGVAAGIDLALALVAADHSPSLARRVSQQMVVYLNRAGGQSQFSERTTPNTDTHGDLTPAFDAVIDDPAARHTVASLADRARMSERTFARRFKAATGTTPARWVERRRIDIARELLESRTLSLAAVSARSGFRSEHTMRQAFARVMGMSPAQYRRIHQSSR